MQKVLGHSVAQAMDAQAEEKACGRLLATSEGAGFPLVYRVWADSPPRAHRHIHRLVH